MTTTHLQLGSVAGGGYALVAHLPLWQVGASALAATLVSGGRLSPDIDQWQAWKRMDRWVPDEMLGHGGPLGHRGVTHWWGTHVALGVAWSLLVPGSPWLGHALTAGGTSHLAGDLVFGRASPYDHRGPGIPLAPWWGHIGLGLKVDGIVERWVFRRSLLPLGQLALCVLVLRSLVTP
jgi:hypothetical protein